MRITLTLAVILLGAPALAADYEPGTPHTYLFDSGTASAEPLSAEALAAKTGWTLLDEDDTAHKFAGDAVLMNDRLAVVLRARHAWLELYSQAGGKWKQRAALGARPADRFPTLGEPAAVIAENTRAAVALEVTTKAADFRPLKATYSLAAGQRIVEIRPGEGVGRLVIASRTRYAVVPDFFADDMVFGPAAVPEKRLGLPTENLLLNLLDGGGAMLMCAWRSGGRAVQAARYERSQPPLLSPCEIPCAGEKTLWLAVLEGPGLWTERSIKPEEGGSGDPVESKPPFPAHWRTDYVRPDGATRAQPFPGAEHAVTYLLDRTKDTPLTAFCPTDVMRDTLGIGPCQYILQTEGLATETNPTPDQVMAFVEKQFERKKEKKSSDEIKDLLQQMTEQVGQTEVRIAKYAAFAREVRGLCGQSSDGPSARARETFGRIAAEMEEAVAADRGGAGPVQQTARLVKEIVALIGKDDPLADCRKLAAEVRDIGLTQDRTLSKCRMAARWLKQQAAMIAASDPSSSALASQASAAVEKVLANK